MQASAENQYYLTFTLKLYWRLVARQHAPYAIQLYLGIDYPGTPTIVQGTTKHSNNSTRHYQALKQ